MYFNFAKLESIDQDSEDLEPTTTESALDNLDVTDEIKDEIENIIEEAVEEAVDLIKEGEAIADEVVATTSTVEDIVETTESLMLLYNVIQEHGVSAPIIKLVDANGAFRKAVHSAHPNLSFESLSSTPDFGELKVACENALLTNIKKAAEAAWKYIKKLAAKIRDGFLNVINIFLSYQKQFDYLKKKLADLNLTPEQEKTVKIDVPLDMKTFESFLKRFTDHDLFLNLIKAGEDTAKLVKDKLLRDKDADIYNGPQKLDRVLRCTHPVKRRGAKDGRE